MSKQNTELPDKPADEIIQDLILRRKQQQEALIKIKASMEKKQPAPTGDRDNQQPAKRKSKP